MSNILQQFLADRAKRQPVTNDAPQVTRPEFNTLAKVVEGLVEDIEAATSPEKIQKVFTDALNSALKDVPATGGSPATNALRSRYDASRVRGEYRAPVDDDGDAPADDQRAPRTNALGYTAPEGD